jgi:hypothetical protein
MPASRIGARAGWGAAESPLGESSGPETCKKCFKAASDAQPLVRCPICYKAHCKECGYDHSGRTFCSQHCANYYFFADPDDEEP